MGNSARPVAYWLADTQEEEMNWKRWWQSRTLWFNGCGLGLVLFSPEVHRLVCEDRRMATVIMVANIVLRLRTNAAVKVG